MKLDIHDVDLSHFSLFLRFTFRILKISNYRIFKSSKSTYFESGEETSGTQPKPGKVVSKVNFSELDLFNFDLFFR